jgi:hypothetical protein
MLVSEITKILKPANSPFFRAARSVRIDSSSKSINPLNPRPVLVFSTSVESLDQVRSLAPVLNVLAGRGQWNFALDDSDRILRIVCSDVNPIAAIRLLREHGFDCKELED